MNIITKLTVFLLLSFSLCLPTFASRLRVKWQMNSNTFNLCWLDCNGKRLSKQMAWNDKDSGEITLNADVLNEFEIRCNFLIVKDFRCGQPAYVSKADIDQDRIVLIDALAVASKTKRDNSCSISIR